MPETQDLPIPPLAMRESVGPTDPAVFDNPTGDLLFPQVSEQAYRSVFDFGCGCGRIARQLIQQRVRPESYLGIDLHGSLVEWCQQNLSPHAPGFRFEHHDVWDPVWNDGAQHRDFAPFPAADDSHTLVLAWSVFTHLLQVNAETYLGEVARILAPGGVFLGTWFLFDKRLFPMMQDFQNALYINEVTPTNAVIFDREWLVETATAKGLVITSAIQPPVRGFQWTIGMEQAASGAEAVELPEDEAPIVTDGAVRAAAIQPDLSDDAEQSG